MYTIILPALLLTHPCLAAPLRFCFHILLAAISDYKHIRSAENIVSSDTKDSLNVQAMCTRCCCSHCSNKSWPGRIFSPLSCMLVWAPIYVSQCAWQSAHRNMGYVSSNVKVLGRPKRTAAKLRLREYEETEGRKQEASMLKGNFNYGNEHSLHS